MRAALATLARQFGIQRSYRAASGELVHASEEAVLAALATLGVATEGSLAGALARASERAWRRLLEPVVLAWNSRPDEIRLRVSKAASRRALSFELKLESGDVVSGGIPAHACRVVPHDDAPAGRLELALTLPHRIPVGYHQLHIETADDRGTALLISAPRRCYAGDRPRAWGVFAPVYALREDDHQPIGELHDLAALLAWIAELNGDFVGTLPISAAFLREPFDPSPYAPASRLFWNEVYLTLEREDGRTGDPADLVDYRAVAAQKRARLEPQVEDFFANAGSGSAEFRKFLKLYPDARDYASFRAAGDRLRAGWGAWPARARAGRLTIADYDQRDLHYHLYAQFLAHRQLSALSRDARARGTRLYLDMPLGVHPDSYDIWKNRDLFVTGASAGAPPDPFFTNGQNWGFPPAHPERMREQGYAYWRKVLQTQLRYAGILRLDHVMSLHRLYVIPAGLEAKAGVYVRYPAEELYAILTIESHRHEAAVVGEDLGTVPAEVRKSMGRHGVKRMFVVQFEATDDRERPLGPIGSESVASLNTHDMPPFRAYWEARDGDLRRELGLLDDQGVAALRASRARTARALSRLVGTRVALPAREAHDALLQLLARSPADMLLLNLEDVWLETEPQNVPGTALERPNWRRRLKFTLGQLRQNRRVREVLTSVERARRSPTSEP